MHRNFDFKSIKTLLKNKIIAGEEQDFSIKNQKLMARLVQSKIVYINQDALKDNILDQKFVGHFLDVW